MTRRFSDYFSDIIGEQKSLFEEQEPVFRRSSSLQMLDSLPFTVEDNNHHQIAGSNNKQFVLPVQLENTSVPTPSPNIIVNNVESPSMNNNNAIHTPTQRIVIKQQDADLQQQQQQSLPYTSTSDMILREVLSNPQLAAQVLNLMLKQPLQQQQQPPTQFYQPNYFVLPQATSYVQNQIQQAAPMQSQLNSPVLQQQHHQNVVSSPPPMPSTTTTKFIPSHYEHHHNDEMEAKKLKPIKRDPKEAYILVRGARKSVFCDLAQMEVLNSLPYKYCFKLVLPFASESDYHYLLNTEHIKFELLCHENEKEYVVDKGIVAEKLMRSKMFADRRELEYKVYLSAYSHGFNRNAFIIRLSDSHTSKVLLQTNEILIYARRNKSGGNGANGDTTKRKRSKEDGDGNTSPSKKQKV